MPQDQQDSPRWGTRDPARNRRAPRTAPAPCTDAHAPGVCPGPDGRARGPPLPRAHGGLLAEVGGQPGPQAQPERTGPGAALPEPWLPVWSLRPGQGCPQQHPACFTQMPRRVHRPETTASRSSTRRAANQSSVSAGPLAHHLPGVTQRGGESARSGLQSPLEAQSPDWP